MLLLEPDSGRIVLANPAAEQLYGRALKDLVALHFRDLSSPSEPTQGCLPVNYRFSKIRQTHADGELFEVEVVATPAEFGRRQLTLLVLKPTEPIQQELEAFNRYHHFLKIMAECQQHVLRADNELNLLQDICDLLIQYGSYRMAWVGYAEEDEECRVRPIAWAGEENGYLSSIVITWGDAATAQGPTGTAIRERRPISGHRFCDEPRLRPWREAALQRGYGSSLALPLLDDPEHCLGALTIYSSESDFFDEERMQQLSQLGKDLALGIRMMRQRQGRLEAERQLQELTQASPTVLYSLERLETNWHTLQVSESVERITGYSTAQAVQPGWWENGLHPEEREGRIAAMKLFVERGGGAQEYRFRHALGHYLWIYDELRLSAGGKQLVGSWTDFSQRRLAEEALLESESRYRDLFQANPQPMWVADRKSGCFLDVNQSALKHYGYGRREFLEKAITDLRVEECSPCSGICRHYKKDGTVILVELTTRSLQFEGREAQLVLAQDVTRRERATASLALQARRSAALLELRRMGETLEEPAFLQEGLQMARQLAESGQARLVFLGSEGELEQGGVRAVLQRRPVLEEGELFVPVLEEGVVVLLLVVSQRTRPFEREDIETVELLADALWVIVQRRRSQERLLQLSRAVEQNPHSVVITNLKAEISYVNQAFLDHSGYAREEVLGKNPRILQSGKTPPGVYQEMWSTLSRGEPWRGELQNRRKDGSEYSEMAIVSPIRQSDGRITHYVGIKEDISERKRLDEELEQHRHRLEHLVQVRTAELAEASQQAETANRAKSVFLANMSHEIRTPLNAIVGLTHLLRRSGVTPAQASRLHNIDTAGRHLLSVINEVLDMAKIEAGHFELESADFQLGGLLSNVVSLIAGQAEARGLKLKLEVPKEDTWVRGDATRIRQALLNYTSNALKFSNSGTVRVGYHLVEEKQEDILVRFEVEDNGIGIAPEKLARLFQTFDQLDSSTTRKYGGSGLGLAITARLAQLLGGEVGVDSRLGLGSTFWFTARLARSRQRIGTTEVSPNGSAESQLRELYSGARILVAEDHPINREVAMDLLQAVGLQVDLAEDGAEALEQVRTRDYDLILMDLQMPILDGLAATRAIRTLPERAEVPILAMTANAFEDDRRACLEAGMNDFVTKPVDPPILYSKLLQHLSGQQSLFSEPYPAVASISDFLAQLPGMNVSQGLAVLRGDQEKYLRLLTQWVESTSQELSSWVQGEPPVVRLQAHNIKGVAANLGATAIAELAGAIEKEGTISCQQTEQLRLALATLQGALPVLPPKVVPKTSLHNLPELVDLLRRGDTQAETLVEEQSSALRAALGNHFGLFERMVNQFDFEQALQALSAAGLLPTPGEWPLERIKSED